MSDLNVVSSEAREEDRLRRLLSGQGAVKKWSPQVQTSNSLNSPPSHKSESKLNIQAKAINAAITTAERELSQINSKIANHEATILDLEKRIEKERNEINLLKEKETSLQVLVMEKNIELTNVNDSIEDEEKREKQIEEEKKQKALEQAAKQKEEYQLKVEAAQKRAQEEYQTSSDKPDVPVASPGLVSNFAKKFQDFQVPKEEIKSPKKTSENSNSLADKEQERLNRSIAKDPAKQPVKVTTTPVPKPTPVVVQKVEVPKGPTLLETLMQKEGTPKTFKWETWDDLDVVQLIGTFTNWQLLDVPRVKGVFIITLPIESGTHLFRYKVNGKFELEKNQPKSIAPDGEYATKFDI